MAGFNPVTFNKSKKYAQQVASGVTDITVNGNALQFKIAATGEVVTMELPTIDKTLTKDSQAADAKTVGDRFSELNQTIVDRLGTKTIQLIQDNVIDFINGTIEDGKYLSDDVLKNNADYQTYTDYYLVKSNTKYTAWKGAGYTFSSIFAFYDKDKNWISTIKANPFTTPANAQYVRMSVKKATVSDGFLVCSEGEAYKGYKPFTNKEVECIDDKVSDAGKKALADRGIVLSDYKPTVSSDELLKIYDCSDAKKENVITFYAEIDGTFGSVEIDVANKAKSTNNYVAIDGTNIISYTNSSTVSKTVAHGLTIDKFVNVEIRERDNNKADVSITTVGGTFTATELTWKSARYGAVCVVKDCTLNNATLKYYLYDLKHDIWAFGDSYFDHFLPSFSEFKATNFYCDGFSGRKSMEAERSLACALKMALPKTILWCMGMNDPDSDSEISANWVTAKDELLKYCDRYGIKPIFATIPNVPERNHTFKNDWIRNSGYDYIDISKYVGAEESTSWYSGLLSSDNVHPSPLGDDVITKYYISQIPELIR